MQTAASPKLCETCGSSLDVEVPSGFCPACLLTIALGDAAIEQTAAAGSRIEDYERLQEVARGGMGIVYRARQRTPSRVVALKMILPTHLGSPGAVQRFRAEAEAAASLDHEAILPIYAVGEHDGAPFYSMKFAEGGTLAERQAHYRDKPRECAALIARVARAVAHAHEHGILHRDLKPGNVLFDSAGKPYVSDFGLAKWLERECDLTQTLAILGTPFYMAPEQATDSRAVTPAADTYSLGAILYHLLTGHPPFDGDNPMEVLHNAARHALPRPRSTNRYIPADLETICLKCLEKEPNDRYSSASALADDLDRFCDGRAIQARHAGLTRRAWRWTGRNPMVAGLAAASAALLAVLLFSLPSRHERIRVDANKSVAVLPFEDVSQDQASVYFVSGIQDDLLVNLSKVSELRVVSRNSVLPYKNPQRDLRAIGKALDVRTVVEGKVRREGERVRITVQLIDAASGQQLWAENYDREMIDVFDIQSDLALQIASALKAKLTPRESTGLRRLPTQNGDAYLLYMQANALFQVLEKKRTELERAAQLYQQAIDLDPTFALACAQLSQLETFYFSMFDPAVPRLERARALAEKAVHLQPDLPEAHLALGRYYGHGEGSRPGIDYERGMAEYEIAERDLPHNAEIHIAIGKLLRHLGKWEQSNSRFERAAALEPNNMEAWQRLYGNHLRTRNYPAAADALRRVILISPNSWQSECNRAWLEVFWKEDVSGLRRLRTPTGSRPEEAFVTERFSIQMFLGNYTEAERLLLHSSQETFAWREVAETPKAILLGELYQRTGDERKAHEQFSAALSFVERNLEERSHDPFVHLAAAQVYAGLGRKEEAVRLAERAAEMLPVARDALYGPPVLDRLAEIYVSVGEGERALPIIAHSLKLPCGIHPGSLRLDPVWQPLRGDPRFERLSE